MIHHEYITDSLSRFIPARRFGGEEEMAGSVLYLASRAGSVSIYFEAVSLAMEYCCSNECLCLGNLL